MNTEIPERYDNPRAGTAPLALTAFAATAVMAITNTFQTIHIPTWLLAAPAALIAVRIFLYTLIVNAIHEGMTLAAVDRMVDSAEIAARYFDDPNDFIPATTNPDDLADPDLITPDYVRKVLNG